MLDSVGNLSRVSNKHGSKFEFLLFFFGQPNSAALAATTIISIQNGSILFGVVYTFV